MIRHLDPATSIDEMAAVLDRDGALVIDGLFGPEVLDPVAAELAPVLAAAVPAGGDFLGNSTKAVPGLLARSPAFAVCTIDPVLLALADHALLPGCRDYQLQITTAQEVWPGGQEQLPHRDESVYGPFLDYRPEAAQYVLGVIVAGTEFTADNGATRVAPGSHRWDPERKVTPQDLEPAAMVQGSALVYFGRTIHHAGANVTDSGRTAYIFGYSVGWLRQEENLLVECPTEYAVTLPERAQQLIGYKAYSPIVGWAADRDPELLTRAAPPGHQWPAALATEVTV
jgi:ectoine hydroxylase-related dioxygenase (phytanoyl-CoA dioxygenase family)